MIETFEKILFCVNRIRVMNTDMDYRLLKTGHGLVLHGNTGLNDLYVSGNVMVPVYVNSY